MRAYVDLLRMEDKLYAHPTYAKVGLTKYSSRYCCIPISLGVRHPPTYAKVGSTEYSSIFCCIPISLGVRHPPHLCQRAAD